MFYKYYQEELSFLRELGKEFSLAHPAAAHFLTEAGSDPDVERLLEGFAFLTGRIKPGQPMLTEALVLTLLCVGLALWAEASFLIAAIVMGAVVTNTARHHEYPFHAIENIERPFLIVFFVLAGAVLELELLWQAGLICIAYISCRVLGKIVGAAAGVRLSGASAATGRWMGIALLPQAGVAMGMALVAATAFPDYRDVLLPVVIGATVVFEIVGPIGTRIALAAIKKIE